MDDIENEIETVTERILFLKKELSTATHKKCLLLAELEQLTEHEEQLKLKLDKEFAREKLLRSNKIEKSIEVENLYVKLNTNETQIPLQVVDEYGYSDVTCTPEVDPNIIDVQFEEARTYNENINATGKHIESDDVNESTSLVDNVGSYDIVSDSLHANQLLDDSNSEVGVIIESITCTIESSSAWQDDGSYSNTSNNYSSMLQRSKNLCSHASSKRSVTKSKQKFIRTNSGERSLAPTQSTGTRGRLVCAICNKEFRRFLIYKSHMLTHNEEPAYGCAECNLKFVTSRRYNAHMRKHTGEKLFACHQCDRRFSLRYSLTNHLKLHNGQFDHLCTVCGRGYIDSAGLRQHMTTHALKHRCDVCGKRFANLQAVVNHRYVHTDESPFVCNVCGHCVKTSKGLSYHMNTHNEIKKHACQLCDSRFHQVGHLRSHMRTHSGEMAFACKECSMTFYNGYKLKLHLRTHEDVDQKLYACTQCDKTFVLSGSLKAHLLTHSTDTPYRCDNCDKQYKRLFDLRMHRVKVHRGLLTPAELEIILTKRSLRKMLT